MDATRRFFLLGAGALALWGGEANANRMRLRGVGGDAPVFPVTKLAPNPQWNGTAGSGYDGAGVARPTSVSRATAKPWGRLLISPFEAFGSDLTLPVDSGTSPVAGGVNYVRFYCEGNYLDVDAETWDLATDINGDPDHRYAFNCILDHTEALAQQALGKMEVWFEAIPNNAAMQPQVQGPFYFYPRQAVSGPRDAGALKVVQKVISVTKSLGTDVAGSNYNSIKKALDYAHDQRATYPLCKIILEEAGGHRMQKVANESFARDYWTPIEAASGVAAVIGDGENLIDPTNNSGMQFDGLSFEGRDLEWNWAAVSYNYQGMRLRTNSNRMIRFRGSKIRGGTPNPALGGSGSDMSGLYQGNGPPGYFITSQVGSNLMNIYFENVDAAGLPDYGLSFCKLIRNCILDGVTGSAMENVHGAIHGVRASRIGGVWGTTGIGTPQDAFSMTVVGGGVAEYEITGTVGSSGRLFKLWYDGALVLSQSLYKTPAPAYTFTALVAAIDALANFSATIGSATLAAAFVADQGATGEDAEARQTITGTRNFVAFVGIHANVLVWHSSLRENVAVRFVQASRIAGAAHVSINESTTGVNDLAIRNSWFCDVGEALGVGVSGGYIGAISSHLFLGRLTLIGGTTNFTDSFEPDAYCQVDRSHFHNLSYSTRSPAVYPDLEMTNLSFLASAQAVMPPGVDANSHRVSGTEEDLFADLSVIASPDPTPELGLRLPDLSYPGALNDNSEWNVAA